MQPVSAAESPRGAATAHIKPVANPADGSAPALTGAGAAFLRPDNKGAKDESANTASTTTVAADAPADGPKPAASKHGGGKVATAPSKPDTSPSVASPTSAQTQQSSGDAPLLGGGGGDVPLLGGGGGGGGQAYPGDSIFPEKPTGDKVVTGAVKGKVPCKSVFEVLITEPELSQFLTLATVRTNLQQRLPARGLVCT